MGDSWVIPSVTSLTERSVGIFGKDVCIGARLQMHITHIHAYLMIFFSFYQETRARLKPDNPSMTNTKEKALE